MFEKSFCSSPWFHIKLSADGTFLPCRWGNNSTGEKEHNIKFVSISDYYNSAEMKDFRLSLLNGEFNKHCDVCYYEESYGKLNGRLRQLNKSGIDANNFELTAKSSPHYNNFKFSLDNHGLANLSPVDLQIDLGNTCNSACIMCDPKSSSRLEKDYEKLNKINSKLFIEPKSYKSWTHNKSTVDKFVDEISKIKNLRYLHFLGGETLFEESFYQICDKLIESGISKNIIIGTTTNGTIFNEKIVNYITNFKEFHLGISIESITSLNDYIRWPSDISSVTENIHKFLSLRDLHNSLYISLRITPNVFSIYDLDKLFVFMLENNVIAESCNILYDPVCLKIELLPEDIRSQILEKLSVIIDYYQLEKNNVVNIRRNDLISQVISNNILDYYNIVKNFQTPANVEQLRRDLVQFIKSFESLRGNNILDYLPEYENFLRSYGL
jgi:MoaA/NifB/PqqE/SkfB family radical SAM enzyme